MKLLHWKNMYICKTFNYRQNVWSDQEFIKKKSKEATYKIIIQMCLSLQYRKVCCKISFQKDDI
jgi:hypothetical protein